KEEKGGPQKEKEKSPGKVAEGVSPGRAAKERERLLGALGTASAVNLFQAYYNIGLLADGVEASAHTKADAEEMLARIANMLRQVDRQLDKVLELELAQAEKESIEGIQAITQLLLRQASALRAYWATGAEEQITRFHKAREASWESISELFGM